MRIVVQRVKEAQVEVNCECVGEIGEGLALLVCMEKGDDEPRIEKAIQKILKMRVFPNPEREDDRMDLNIIQAGKEILAISQFTLCWRGEKGHRPSFDLSMPPQEAEKSFNMFCDRLRETMPVETGRFGEHMQVKILNDGPVTFSLDF